MSSLAKIVIPLSLSSIPNKTKIFVYFSKFMLFLIKLCYICSSQINIIEMSPEKPIEKVSPENPVDKLTEKEIMTVDDCAVMLTKSKDTIRKYVANRTIPFYKKNGSVYFLRSEILKWLKDGKQ